VTKWWRRYATVKVNIGGLAAGVYLLHRTSAVYTLGRAARRSNCDLRASDIDV